MTAELTALSNRALAEFVPELRASLVGQVALSGVAAAPAIAGASVPDAALIHTAYFLSDDVLRLIAHHISQSSKLPRESEGLSPALLDWYTAEKERLVEAAKRMNPGPSIR